MFTHYCPGLDGLTSEFYKLLKEVLSKQLWVVFGQCLMVKKLPASWMVSRIILIPKLDKDLMQPLSYRTITLLNTVYKILAKILAVRLECVLINYIHPDQTGFLKDR